MNVINLETICAEYGWKIAQARGLKKPSDKENLVTKALGVLAENGFYAMNVFLLSCNLPKDEDGKPSRYGETVENLLREMLACDDLALLDRNGMDKNAADALPDLRGITADLPRLILARRVTEQALTFARYHCKALGKNEKKAKPQP